MNVATAIAHPNIALIKYWGKRDLRLNLPAVSSLSLTLAGFRTRTRVVWGADADTVQMNGAAADESTHRKVASVLDLIDANRPPCAVESDNNFPTGAGLASSASGFAALTVAGAAAAQAQLDDIDLSRIARQGSGSACRSLWGGWVTWDRGSRADGQDSHGAPLAGPDHWDVCMVAAVVSQEAKPVGSTEGMERTRKTSPFWSAWVDTSEADLAEARQAVLSRDLPRLGEVMERSTHKMHATMWTASPAILYWLPATVACLHAVAELRRQGIGAWATMDAGPQVKVLCQRSDADRVASALASHAVDVHVLAPGGPPELV